MGADAAHGGSGGGADRSRCGNQRSGARRDASGAAVRRERRGQARYIAVAPRLSPGTELNLDLARAIQRAGWNVLAIHYRGVWGLPGKFSFAHTIEDSNAALAWLRASENAAKYGIDTGKLVVPGHSMGGFDTVMLE